MKRLIKPENFYRYTTQGAIYFAIAGAFFLAYGILAGLFVAPIDYQQREAVRIMYVHVPCAILSLTIYTIIGAMSLVYLIWKVKIADVIAQASAPFGAMLTLLALITGALWGKPMWGTWWVWDARLTSELILLFLYCGYMGLRSAILDPYAKAMSASILAVVGLIDIPIIHFSVNWWNTLHQGASLSRWARPAIANGMLYPLLSMIIALYLLYMSLVCLGARSAIVWRERKTKWVRLLIEERYFNV